MANIEMMIDSIRVSMMNYQAMRGGAASGFDDNPRVLVLKEKAGARHLPIWIGPAEADAIAVKIQGVEPSRPLAPDFTCAVIDAVGANLESAIINALENDTFYAKVVLRVEGVPLEVDCRPSDALAVAIRLDAPIFADEEVLKKASIVLPEAESLGQRADDGRLEIFSKDAQDILAASEAEARHMHHDYISTGHLLITLAKKKNTATEIMKDAGANLGRIQKDLKALMKREHPVEGGGVGLTPAVKEMIQTSIDEARKLGSEEVLPEHVLLGLIRANDGIAANQLRDLGITPEIVYTELIRLRKQS
jgi:bifunctional DNase/RNase